MISTSYSPILFPPPLIPRFLPLNTLLFMCTFHSLVSSFPNPHEIPTINFSIFYIMLLSYFYLRFP